MAQVWADRNGMSNKPWAFGFLLVLAFAVIGELLMAFDSYIFHRLGISRNLLLTTLWLLPMAASFVASAFSQKHQLLAGLSFLLLFPLVGATAHYINGQLGGTVDFVGVPGAVETFKLYVAIGSVLMIIGTALGLAFSNKLKGQSRSKTGTD
jgi:hypothetical protein